jgi:hypothetical protein
MKMIIGGIVATTVANISGPYPTPTSVFVKDVKPT